MTSGDLIEPDGVLYVMVDGAMERSFPFKGMGKSGWHWCSHRNVLVVTQFDGGRVEIPRETVQLVAVQPNSPKYMLQQRILAKRTEYEAAMALEQDVFKELKELEEQWRATYS